MSSAAPPLSTHRVGDAVVTLATIPELQAEAQRLEAEANATGAGAQKLRADAVQIFVEAGLLLVARSREWASAYPAAAVQLDEANEVIRAMEAEGIAVDPADSGRRRGLGGLFRRKDPPVPPEVQREREERNAQLRVLLAEVGRNYGGAHPAVASAHARATTLDEQSHTDDERAARMRADAADLVAEAAARQETVAELGFDVLFVAASLEVSGPAEAKSPLDLRPGERLLFTLPAELARQKSLATPDRAEQGFTFPPQKTGIQYRLGRYVGQPIRQDDLARLGGGTFVLTDQRLGFVGSVKSFSYPLSSVRWATQYRDGLVFLREGRENADVLLTPAAGQALFYLNWALDRTG